MAALRCVVVVQVVEQAAGHFQNVTLMAENGHFERLAFNESSKVDTASETVGPTEWIPTTPEVDLSWMDPVEDSCHYFEQRTPGSSVSRTSRSVTFNYSYAQR